VTRFGTELIKGSHQDIKKVRGITLIFINVNHLFSIIIVKCYATHVLFSHYFYPPHKKDLVPNASGSGKGKSRKRKRQADDESEEYQVTGNGALKDKSKWPLELRPYVCIRISNLELSVCIRMREKSVKVQRVFFFISLLFFLKR
jgi:hypothetical protein